MTPEFIVELARKTILTGLLITAPLMLIAFFVDVIMSLVQAVTQIQEMTLSFIPKFVSMMVVLVVFGHWMLIELLNYSREVFTGFVSVVTP